MREAAEACGIGEDRAAARRLLRLLRRRELVTGKRIVIEAPRGGRHLVTLASLRRHFSDLVDEGGYYEAVLEDVVEWVRAELRQVRAELRQASRPR